jgi:biopolymer transport protein ExbD
MKASMRARRMARNHRRMKTAAKLTLVPIIDIFTMLLFFLMMNTGNVEVLDLDKTIKLPQSSADRRPDQTVLIKINAEEILVQGRVVARVADVLAGGEEQIAGLRNELDGLAAGSQQLTGDEKNRGRAVTIMGDQQVPYTLLKRVMTTCAQADYRDIALAVERLPEQGGAPAATHTTQGA